MAILATITGAAGIANSVAGAVNKGTCGAKCYGFGKALRRCREKRTADCQAAERQKAAAKREAEAEEQRILAAKNSDYKKAPVVNTAGMSIPQGWAIPAAALAVIFFFFNFYQKA